MRIDPGALGELLEEGAIETARGTIVDILDCCLMAKPGIAQAKAQPPVTSVAGLLVEQQGEPFGVGERRRFAGCFDLAEGLGHAVEPELMKKIKGGMGKQGRSPQW